MNAKDAFVASENRIMRRWTNSWTEDNLVLHEHRMYRCDCGFTSTSPARIYDHASACTGKP